MLNWDFQGIHTVKRKALGQNPKKNQCGIKLVREKESHKENEKIFSIGKSGEYTVMEVNIREWFKKRAIQWHLEVEEDKDRQESFWLST